MAVFNAVLRFLSNGGNLNDLECATPETVSIWIFRLLCISLYLGRFSYTFIHQASF